MAAQAHPQRNSYHTQGTGVSGDQRGGWQATMGSVQRSGGCKSFLIAYTMEVRRLSSHTKRACKGTDCSASRPQMHAGRHLQHSSRLHLGVAEAPDVPQAEQ